MKKETFFLKLAVFLMGTPIAAACIYIMYEMLRGPVHPDYDQILYPLIIGLFASAIPFFFALYQAYQLLTYIDKNEAFSEISVIALKKIKYCAFIISGIYVIILPF